MWSIKSRARIGKDLYDSVSQYLSVLKLKLSSLKSLWPAQSVRAVDSMDSQAHVRRGLRNRPLPEIWM